MSKRMVAYNMYEMAYLMFGVKETRKSIAFLMFGVKETRKSINSVHFLFFGSETP